MKALIISAEIYLRTTSKIYNYPLERLNVYKPLLPSLSGLLMTPNMLWSGCSFHVSVIDFYETPTEALKAVRTRCI